MLRRLLGMQRVLFVYACVYVSVYPDSPWSALAVAAVAAAGIEYEIVGKPLLTIQEAIAAGSYFKCTAQPVIVGNAECTYVKNIRKPYNSV